MQPEERQKRIEQYLARVEFASLEELARQVSASPSTVRRDLNTLESGGLLRRTHGGARLLNAKPEDYIFTQRTTVEFDAKESIAKTCAKIVQPRQSVIVDAGTTAFQVARFLQDKTLQVITNSLPVANLFASNQSTEVIVSGGLVYPRLGVLVGPVAVELFSKTHADIAIMSGGGITADGITNSHALLIDIQRAMIKAAGRVIFCFDHTKIGRKSVAHLCELSDIDTVITDSGAPANLLEELSESGVEVILAAQEEISPVLDSTAEILPAPAKDPKSNIPSGGPDLSGGMSWD